MTVLQYHRLPVLAHQHRPSSFLFFPILVCAFTAELEHCGRVGVGVGIDVVEMLERFG